MLTARVLWQRGIPSWAHPPATWKPVLEQLGLWHPSVIGSMLPVAATLLVVGLVAQDFLQLWEAVVCW